MKCTFVEKYNALVMLQVVECTQVSGVVTSDVCEIIQQQLKVTYLWVIWVMSVQVGDLFVVCFSIFKDLFYKKTYQNQLATTYALKSSVQSCKQNNKCSLFIGKNKKWLLYNLLCAIKRLRQTAALVRGIWEPPFCYGCPVLSAVVTK